MRKKTLTLVLVSIILGILVIWVQQLWSRRIFEIGGFAMAIVWLVAFICRRQQPRWSFALIPPVAAAVWAWGQVYFGFSSYLWKTENAALYWASNAAYFFVALQAFVDNHLWRRFAVAVTLFGGLLAVVSTAQFFTSDSAIFWLFETDASRSVQTIMGPFLNRNQYSAFIEILLPIAMFGALRDRRFSTWYGVAAGAMYASVIAASSRAGAVLCSVELVAVPLLLWRRGALGSRRAMPALGALAASLVALVLAVGPEVVVERLQQDPFVGRRDYFASSIVMAKDHAWTGVGLGNWATVYPRYARFDDGSFANQAHNDWAQWTVEGGLPMLVLMISLALWAIPKAVRSVWGIGVIAILVHCWVDYPVERTGMATLFFVLLAALAHPSNELDGAEQKTGSK